MIGYVLTIPNNVHAVYVVWNGKNELDAKGLFPLRHPAKEKTAILCMGDNVSSSTRVTVSILK